MTTFSQLFSLQPPAESEGNGSAASSLASSPHQSEGSQAKEKEHNTPDTETAGEVWAELLALFPCFHAAGSCPHPAILQRCWQPGGCPESLFIPTCPLSHCR